MAEIYPGINASELPIFIEKNKDRLRIKEYRKHEQAGEVWFTLHLNKPVSLIALFKHEGSLCIRLEDNNQKVSCVIWYM